MRWVSLKLAIITIIIFQSNKSWRIRTLKATYSSLLTAWNPKVYYYTEAFKTFVKYIQIQWNLIYISCGLKALKLWLWHIQESLFWKMTHSEWRIFKKIIELDPYQNTRDMAQKKLMCHIQRSTNITSELENSARMNLGSTWNFA